MGKLADQWSAAKKAFVKAEKFADNAIPLDIVEDIDDGGDFGPSLKAFEKAETHPERMEAMPGVLKGKEHHRKTIERGLKVTKSPKGKKALKDLQAVLVSIWDEVQTLAQPPRPGGSKLRYTLRKIDLAKGAKPKYLKLDPIPVEGVIEVDKTLAELMEKGRHSLRLQHLGDIAWAEIDKCRAAFVDTIMKVDARLGTDLTPANIEKTTAEANAILKYYAKIVEDNANRAVETEWQAFLQRRDDLSSFRIKTGVKIAMTTIGVGVAVASVVLSFGTAWMNIIVAAKGITEIGKSIKTAAEGIDTTYEALVDDMEHVTALIQQREKARIAEEGQKASKAKEMGKEVLAALLPLTKNIIKAASAIKDRVVQFSGQVSKLESEADKLSGKVEAITKNLSSLPPRLMSTEQTNLSRRMNKLIADMTAQLQEMHRKIVNAAAFATRARKAIEKLIAEDSWAGGMTTTMKCGTIGVALYGLTNFVYACATAGKALIPI